MKKTVYIETTIPSYLTGRASNNLIAAGEQEVTRQWWEERRPRYHLYVSELVLKEAMQGDTGAAQRRLECLTDIDVLEIDNEAIRLTEALLKSKVFPEKAIADAGHIALAARYELDYLLTWNCKHIANAEMIRQISHVVSTAGYYMPIICTPLELSGGYNDEG